MTPGALPPLPDADPERAPALDDPAYPGWVESVHFSPEGVDRGQIGESLHRTPLERLEVLERAVNDLLALAGGRWPEVR